MSAAIEIRHVSKHFRLYHEHYSSLKERMIHFGRIPFEDFIALDDVASLFQVAVREDALVGGVNLMLTPDVTITFSRAAMLSPDGRSGSPSSVRSAARRSPRRSSAPRR